MPEVASNFEPLVWCPMMIKLKEQANRIDKTQAALIAALNTEVFRDSLKEAYGGKSMSIPIKLRHKVEVNTSSSSGGEEEIDANDV